MTEAFDIAKARHSIQQCMRTLASNADSPYETGLAIWRTAMDHTPSLPDEMHPLWLIWGALTDWVETRPQEREQAEEAMRRAAREWLSLDLNDATAKAAYLDRWVYEELGYEREGRS